MKPLSTYVVESVTQYNKKSIISSASYLSDSGFWGRFFNQIIEELDLPKSSKLKEWKDLNKNEQKKVSDFRKSLI